MLGITRPRATTALGVILLLILTGCNAGKNGDKAPVVATTSASASPTTTSPSQSPTDDASPTPTASATDDTTASATTPTAIGHNCTAAKVKIVAPIAETKIVKGSDVTVVTSTSCIPKGWGLHEADKTDKIYAGGWAEYSGTTVSFYTTDVGGPRLTFYVIAGPNGTCIEKLKAAKQPFKKLPSTCTIAAKTETFVTA